MKMKKETKEILGLSAVFSALVLTVTFIVLAIRRRSVTEALLALAAATGSAVGAALLLDAAVAPDPDGEGVVMPSEDEKTADASELFEGEGCEAAEHAMRQAL